MSNFPFAFVLELGAYVPTETMQSLTYNLFTIAGLLQKDQYSKTLDNTVNVGLC